MIKEIKTKETQDKRRMCVIQNNLYDSLYSYNSSSLNSNKKRESTLSYNIEPNEYSEDGNYDYSVSNYSGSNVSNITCNMCNLESNKVSSNYIILSCCNNVFHVKCLMDKFNEYTTDKMIDNTFILNDNSIDFDKKRCPKCESIMNYEDLFTIYSKNVLSNKIFTKEYDSQLTSLKEQKMKIENEMKCLNEYIIKLDQEKKVSHFMMSKIYSLLCSDI